MKKISLIFISFFLLFFVNISFINAEDFDVQLTPSLYAGGYNISCHGANTGSINLFISGGTAPYTYVWLDGPTVRNRSNLAAGYYRVVVTSANAQSVTREITLTQPDAFQILLYPTEYEGGYNISENGGNNGIIDTEVMGGVPPYTCLWSNGSTSSERISDLVAGVYSLTVHDATNCVASASVTLVEPTQMHLVSISSPLVVGNYNIGCSLTGSINVTVAGGTPPYNYEWEHGPSTQNVNDLTEPGDYGVLIRDENGAEVRTSIALSRSPQITATTTPFVYPNTKNTSCHVCTNGSINTTITSGTAPYTYAWNNGSSAQNPNNLGAGIYSVIITDAAGCSTEKTVLITAPEREDWTMNGNSGVSSGQYIGTNDNNILSLRTNNLERIAIQGNGDIKLSNFTGNEDRFLIVKPDGFLSVSSPNMPWMTRGNYLGSADFFGSLNNADLIFKTDVNAGGGEKMVIKANGKVGIGNPISYPGTYNLYVTKGILTEKIKVAINGSNEWPDYVFEKGYNLKPLEEWDIYIKTNNHLPDVISAEVAAKEGIDVGEMQISLLKTVEELTLHLIDQNRKIENLTLEIQKLKTNMK